MIISPNPVVELKKENGKKVTVGTYGADVTFVVWRKNDSVLLPLVLNRMEAQRLRAELDKAITEANASAKNERDVDMLISATTAQRESMLRQEKPATVANLAHDIQAAVIRRRS